MRLFAFLLVSIIVVFSLGCNAENPLCTDNFCAIGEIFPRSELEEGQAFSEVDIDDSVIFATLAGAMPVETTPAVDTTFDDIIADVAAGGTQYVGQTLEITAPVLANYVTSVILFTNNDNVTFYVKSSENPDLLDVLKDGKTYTLTLEIEEISPPDAEFDWYAIWSELPNDADIVENPPTQTTVSSIVSDVVSGNIRYLGQTIEVSGVVYLSNTEMKNKRAMAIRTGSAEVLWIVFAIEDTSLDAYKKDNTYTFTLFIESITPPNPLESKTTTP